MALPPVSISDWKSVIPTANSSWCAKILQTPGRLAIYAYRTAAWAMNADGTATDDFRTWLGLDTTDEISSPTNVTATDGTSSANVTVSWTSVTGASFYKVYRSTGSTFSAATLLGTSTTTSYVDTSVTADQVYYFWVVATNSAGDSTESTPDTGYAQSGGANSISFTSSSLWTVPSGVTSLTGCVVYGKGGNGGSREYQLWVPPGTYIAGGGGGGGEYCIGTIPVTAGESLSITVDSTSSAIVRGSTTLISCYAGANGSGGSTGGGGGAGGGSSVAGITDGTVTSVTRNPGVAGTAGAGATGGVGGATNPVLSGVGTGGNGSDTASDTNTNGSTGKVILNW
jgi:hypothetical protein